MADKFKIDSAGIAEILLSAEVTAAVAALGEQVASNAEGETASGVLIPIRTRSRTAQGGKLSARPAVDITLAHPAGVAVEAKRGTLARAAAAAGLEVKSREAAG